MTNDEGMTKLEWMRDRANSSSFFSHACRTSAPKFSLLRGARGRVRGRLQFFHRPKRAGENFDSRGSVRAPAAAIPAQLHARARGAFRRESLRRFGPAR